MGFIKHRFPPRECTLYTRIYHILYYMYICITFFKCSWPLTAITLFNGIQYYCTHVYNALLYTTAAYSTHPTPSLCRKNVKNWRNILLIDRN